LQLIFSETLNKWGSLAGPNAEFYTRFKEELNRQFLAKQEFEKKSKSKKREISKRA
jgi:hypothetical protein